MKPVNFQGNSQYRAYVSKTSGSLKPAILNGLEFIGWNSLINKRSRVFVKPNFTFPWYKEGITTSPELLRCLLELLRSKTDSVILGESDGGNHSFTADQAFDGHNILQICSETGVELVNLSKLPSEIVEGNISGKRVKVKLPKLLIEEIDCLISVPVLKVHVMTDVSLGIKNLWGCHPDPMRCLEHQNLAHKLAFITKILKPCITVIDGTYGLDGHGPMFGVPKRLDLIVVANNPVAADSVGAALMSIPLRQASHIRIAEREGLGTTRVEQIKINDGWQHQKVKFTVTKTPTDKLTGLLFKSDALARLVMASPLTSLIYRLAAMLRTSKEKELASEMKKTKTIGLY